MISVKIGETYSIENEVWFDGHLYGSNTGIPNGQIKIRRGTDGYFWDGSDFIPTEGYLATSVSGDGLYHSYSFTFPAPIDTAYTINMRVNNDVQTEVIFTFITRDMSGGGGGSGGTYTRVFDAMDFVLGFGTTVSR